MRLKLEKYHGLGNDYLVFDPEHNGMELTPERVKLLCNRNLGVGADGILEGPVFKEGKIHMIIWNSDGSQTENSGNGIRTQIMSRRKTLPFIQMKKRSRSII